MNKKKSIIEKAISQEPKVLNSNPITLEDVEKSFIKAMEKRRNDDRCIVIRGGFGLLSEVSVWRDELEKILELKNKPFYKQVN